MVGRIRHCITKRAFACLMLLAVICFAHANIVINELCYDPAGTDSGWEWIEIYNSGSQSISMEGWKILKGGSTFTVVYVIPYFLLRPGRYLLIGESNVPNAHFVANLAFQNGGSETDGVQLMSPNDSYTDTVLYDSPNTYALPDDNGQPGHSFAVDVPSGYSLARIKDGFDSNNCAVDFIAEALPTPGSANREYVDYSISSASVESVDMQWMLYCCIRNNSAITASIAAGLEVFVDNIVVISEAVWQIAGGDSLRYEFPLPIEDMDNHTIKVTLSLPNDPAPENNTLILDLHQQIPLPPYINEIMYDPQTGRQEWIELYCANALRTEYRIRDRANNSFSFTLPARSGYFVLCPSSTGMLADYPQCPPDALIQISGWAALNNDGDDIILSDSDGNLIDQMSYGSGASAKGFSLERHPVSDSVYIWRQCLDAEGATPGRINSTPQAPPQEHNSPVAIFGSPARVRMGESISVSYRLSAESNRANCYIYSRDGRRIKVLADNAAIGAQGAFEWDGRDHSGKYAARGIYLILWESAPASGGKMYRRQFTAVVSD